MNDDMDIDYDEQSNEMDIDSEMDELENKFESLFIKPKFLTLQIPNQIHENLSCKTYRDSRYWIEMQNKFSEGAYGNLYNACDKNLGCNFVAKEMDFSSKIYHTRFHQIHFIGECLITQFASEMQFGVPFLTYFLCDRGHKGVLITEKFDGDLTNVELTSQDIYELVKIINTMHDFGILHLDLFPKNIVYKRGVGHAKNIKIIDFGLTIAFGRELEPELKAIDYVTLINSFNDRNIIKILTTEAIKACGERGFVTAKQWVNNRHITCGAEYFILEKLPDQIFKMYGPAVRTLLAWSTRCNSKNYSKIDKMTTQELKKRGLPLE